MRTLRGPDSPLLALIALKFDKFKIFKDHFNAFRNRGRINKSNKIKKKFHGQLKFKRQLITKMLKKTKAAKIIKKANEENTLAKSITKSAKMSKQICDTTVTTTIPISYFIDDDNEGDNNDYSEDDDFNIVVDTAVKAYSLSFISTHSSIPKWLFLFLMLFAVLVQTPHPVAAEKSKHYYMQALCKNHFLQQLYRKVDGAVLWSQNERNLDCVITFQTHSILQRFMLRFDMLQLDCNDHLLIYDGAHAVTTPKVDISCRNTKNTVNLILTRTNFVTLKYVTDGWGTDANGFKLVITSIKDPKHTCKDFTCATREFCIHPDLLCDGVNHCGDNSDESVQNLCQSETASTLFGMDLTWFVLVVVSVLLILSALIVALAICMCRRQDDSVSNQNTTIQLNHASETNGSSKHFHYHHNSRAGTVGGALTCEHKKLPPNSGNWLRPAGPSGYHRILLNY